MRLVGGTLIAVTAVAVLLIFADFGHFVAWTVELQRGFQNQMAGAVRALQSGQAGANLTLFGAAAAYGFVHALGPGHGKYLVGGVGIGSRTPTARLLALAATSSILQALWAIFLVYGGFFLVDATARQLSTVAEGVLASLSYAAIGLVGLALIWRGARTLFKEAGSEKRELSNCHGHSHGPTLDQVASITSFRQAAFLTVSIAIRPCTGAVFLLIIAWQMDIKTAGAVAVLFMGLGTAALTCSVAFASVTAREYTLDGHGMFARMTFVFPVVQMIAGALIAIVSLGFLRLAI